jgi:hypothetical protein
VYYDKTHPAPLGVFLMPFKDKDKRAARDRQRREERKLERAGQPGPQPAKVKRPKPQFAGFIKVRNLRRAANDHEVFLDLIVGQLKLPGCWYNAKSGQLQTSTARDERRRAIWNPAYYVATVRPIIVRALEKAISEKIGRPYRYPKAMRFEPTPRKQRKAKATA